MKNKFRLVREKEFSELKPGESITVKRISEPEFFLRVSSELSSMYQEALSTKSAEKFADIAELLCDVAESIGVDWSEVNKIRFSKRWESGKYGNFIGVRFDQDGSDE